jgi:hypothetical protein
MKSVNLGAKIVLQVSIKMKLPKHGANQIAMLGRT